MCDFLDKVFLIDGEPDLGDQGRRQDLDDVEVVLGNGRRPQEESVQCASV